MMVPKTDQQNISESNQKKKTNKKQNKTKTLQSQTNAVTTPIPA